MKVKSKGDVLVTYGNTRQAYIEISNGQTWYATVFKEKVMLSRKNVTIELSLKDYGDWFEEVMPCVEVNNE